ncbi:MAG: hypothetical protein U0V87_09255 [Acidobacteriota bacterium]
MTVRKQVHELTCDDLEQSAVWEFVFDAAERDEEHAATLQPFPIDGPLDASAGMFVVRASFQLADGTTAVGYLTPPIAGHDGIEIVQPTVLLPNRRLRLWCGLLAPDPEALDRLYEQLERSPPELFPLRYRSSVPLVGGPVQGQVGGFAHYRSRHDMTIVESV